MDYNYPITELLGEMDEVEFTKWLYSDRYQILQPYPNYDIDLRMLELMEEFGMYEKVEMIQSIFN